MMKGTPWSRHSRAMSATGRIYPNTLDTWVNTAASALSSCLENDARVSSQSNSFLRHLLAYNISNIGIFLLRLGLVVVIEKIIGSNGNLVLINLAARMLAGLLNFIISDKLIFKKKVAY